MNEIRFRIGADTSAFSRALTQVQSVAAAAGSQIRKKFDLKEAFKSSVLALGLSIEKVSEKVAEMFTGGSQEAWKSALRAAEDAARTIEDSTMRRMDTVRQIEYLEKEIQRNRAKEDATPQKTGELGTARKVLDVIGENIFSGGAKLLKAVGAKSLGASFSDAAERYRKRGDEQGNGVESEADAAARAQEATAKRLENERRIAELQEKKNRDERRIAAARAELQRGALSDQEKVVSLVKEMNDLYDQAAKALLAGKDATELHLQALAKQKAAQDQILENERKTTSELEKQAQRRAQFIDKYSKYLDAGEKVSDATKGAARARYDSVAFTLEDVLNGNRGTEKDRRRAQAIIDDEARAREMFDSGKTDRVYDSSADRGRGAYVNRNWRFYQNRAEQMRKDFPGLTSAEQDPFKAVDQSLKDANEHLKAIQESLAGESVD